MEAQQAMQTLVSAAQTRFRTPTGPEPCIGVFGNSAPEVLLAAAGFRVLDVKATRDEDADTAGLSDITAYVEPFVDDHARCFLHRLARGDLAHCRAIVFGREDAAALVAYQYALELQRQQVIGPSPRLLLWNLEQGGEAAVLAFNRAQCERLWEQLTALGGVRPDARRLAAIVRAYHRRQAGLAELDPVQGLDAASLTAEECFEIRHAARYLDASIHADCLQAVLATLADRPARSGPRLGLVGTALDDRSVYRMLDRVGVLVADLQPFGAVWPAPVTEPDGRWEGTDTLLRDLAADPFSPRSRQPDQWLEAVVAACAAARCDRVIAQMDQNDDTFGWDLPPLREALAQRGIGLINLGFRDLRPSADWLRTAEQCLRTQTGAV